MSSLLVAKVGGSLFDLSDLRDRIRVWRSGLAGSPVLLVPGGGRAADAVRCLDLAHQLGEANAHWLALRALAVNAHFLSALLGIEVISTPVQLNGPIAVL